MGSLRRIKDEDTRLFSGAPIRKQNAHAVALMTDFWGIARRSSNVANGHSAPRNLAGGQRRARLLDVDSPCAGLDTTKPSGKVETP
jgi:hypothetical protein